MSKYNDWTYDIEVYPNIFTFCAIYHTGKKHKVFEISDRKNDIEELLEFLRNVKRHGHRMVGFNNIGFDYPVIHYILEKSRSAIARGKLIDITSNEIYNHAMTLINKPSDDRFGSRIKDSEVIIPQVDLYLVHHFDNKARSTSLKMLEFNMRSDNIEDLPFPVGSILSDKQKDELIKYNKHDVSETLKFYKYSADALKLREDLSELFGFDCTNFNDTKIGKQLFINSLEKENPGCCYSQGKYGRKINQTKREYIKIKDCLFDYITFDRPEFKAIHEWFKKQIITETKGVFSEIEEHKLGDVAKYSEMITKRKRFKQKPTEDELYKFKKDYPLGWVEEEELKATEYVYDDEGNHILEPVLDEFGEVDPKKKPKKKRIPKKSYWGCWKIAETLNVVVNGQTYYYGTGGIHMSIEGSSVLSDSEYEIIDADVSSMYPNISIVNNLYPKHLGTTFCEVYRDLYKQRKSHPKGSPQNAALKLALNGVYGDSNNEYSPLYDPQYTMSVTLNGQLMLSMLTERLINLGAIIIQCNTDGVTVKIHKSKINEYYQECKEWEKDTMLQLEFAQYDKMFIKDVNNYIAVYKE